MPSEDEEHGSTTAKMFSWAAVTIVPSIRDGGRPRSMNQDHNAHETSGWLFVGTSKINGFGLFSSRTISSGDVVGKLFGAVLPVAHKRTIQIDRHRHLCSDYIDFINHSCRPNAYVRVEGASIVLNAIEQIRSDTDEITIDYNCSEYSLAESFSCRCCQIPNRICGYRYLVETNQNDYLRRINRFALLHLAEMTSEVKRASINPLSR
ncbi:SET domain-containing protein-lysine N-methyltransferase [Bradyrhizobium valentinum]|uniref:SET domain-containing protein-lysine N-methyltransferase n=1 Tax=Bradyrhizobium valentinum TaxID=1518501 RepID=UPI00070F4C7B|nr:SET domain-containing protein [Bradyrhizobium valentinum]